MPVSLNEWKSRIVCLPFRGIRVGRWGETIEVNDCAEFSCLFDGRDERCRKMVRQRERTLRRARGQNVRNCVVFCFVFFGVCEIGVTRTARAKTFDGLLFSLACGVLSAQFRFASAGPDSSLKMPRYFRVPPLDLLLSFRNRRDAVGDSRRLLLLLLLLWQVCRSLHGGNITHRPCDETTFCSKLLFLEFSLLPFHFDLKEENISLLSWP